MEFKKFAVTELEEAIADIIMPKAESYYTDRKNDVVLNELIEKEIAVIEALEDLVSNITSNVDFSNYTEKTNGMYINGYYFMYDKSKDDFVFSGDIESYARNLVLNREGLQSEWKYRSLIRKRIKAILVTLDTQSFEDILKNVEAQLDYNEFINLLKSKNV